MTAAQYQEWKDFDSIEPLDAAGVILQGLAGAGKKQPVPWQVQKEKFLRHIALMKEQTKRMKDETERMQEWQKPK